jgi:cytochrome c
MKKLFVISLFLSAITIAYAEDFASTEQAQTMVKKAVAHIKADGPAKAYADFSAKKPEFTDRDLYVVVYDFTGSVLAHGQNEKMVGKNLIDLKDPDGKAFVRERVDMAKTQASFWQDYKFVDPVTKKVLPKTMYCERLNDTVVCAGVYKR